MKYLTNNQNFINWLRVMRLSQGFFFITLMPVTLGAAIVYHHGGTINYPSFLAVFIGAIFYHLAADMINEYVDFKNGNLSEETLKTPFNGGTGILEKNLLNPKKVLLVGYLFLLIGLTFSLIAIYFSTWWLAILSFLGLISCWGYSAPPLKFCYRGLGEITIFLNNGFFVIISIYLALNQSLDYHLIFPSLFLGLLGFSIITMNELPDYNDDKRINKKNLVVRFGIQRGIIFWRTAIIFAYIFFTLACLTKSLPYLCLIALLSLILPKNFRLITSKISDEDLQSKEKMTFLCGQTIKLKFSAWLLAMIGFFLHHLL